MGGRLASGGRAPGDEVYERLLEAGDAAIPCLINKLTDRTTMPDPRSGYKSSGGLAVGDVAFLVMINITNIRPGFPEELAALWDSQGMQGYLHYTVQLEKSAELASKLEEWLSRKHSYR